jgi:hypothetical protein
MLLRKAAPGPLSIFAELLPWPRCLVLCASVLDRPGSEADAHGRCDLATRSRRLLQKETEQRRPRPTQCPCRPPTIFYAARFSARQETLTRGMGTRLVFRLSDFGAASLRQIPSPAFMGNPIPPSVTDENPERKAKNQDCIDHQVEHGMHPLANAVSR